MEANQRHKGKSNYRPQSTPSSPLRAKELQCTCMTADQLARLKAAHDSKFRSLNSCSQTVPRSNKRRTEEVSAHKTNGAISNCSPYEKVAASKRFGDAAQKSEGGFGEQAASKDANKTKSDMFREQEQQTVEEDFDEMEKGNATSLCNRQIQIPSLHKDMATQEGPSQISQESAVSNRHADRIALKDKRSLFSTRTSAYTEDDSFPDEARSLEYRKKTKSAGDMSYGLSLDSEILKRMLKPVNSLNSAAASDYRSTKRLRSELSVNGYISEPDTKARVQLFRKRNARSADISDIRKQSAVYDRDEEVSPSESMFFDNRCYATTPTSSNDNSDQESKVSPTRQLLQEYEKHLRSILEKGIDAESCSPQTFESLLTQSLDNLGYSPLRKSNTLPSVARIQEQQFSSIHNSCHSYRPHLRHVSKLDANYSNKIHYCMHSRPSSFDRYETASSDFNHVYGKGLSEFDRGYMSDHSAIYPQASLETVDSKTCYLTSSELSDEDRLSLTTAVSDEEEVGSASHSPYKAKIGSSGASFSCTGAIRKTGYLNVKKWLLRKRRQVELARKRGWKGYWVCLKGTTLLFYPCEPREPAESDLGPKHLIIIDGAIMQYIPEHPKRDNVFCLSTAFGDAYLFQASCQMELENWIQNIHCACAAAFARHRGKTGTLHLLQEEIFRLDRAIETESKMLHMAELTLSVVTETENKQQIMQQIVNREENLERFHSEQFRLRCYMASLQNGELPNPKGLLFYASRITKNTLNALGVFSVSSFHAYICARSPSLLNNLLAGRGATKRRAPMLSRSNSCSSRRSTSVGSAIADVQRTCSVHLPDDMVVTVCLRDPMSVEEFLITACNKNNLNPMEHFVRVKKRREMADTNYFVPHRNELIENYLQTHEIVEICAKLLYQVELVRHCLDQLWGFSVEAELIENVNRQDELCVYVSRVEDRSYAIHTGIIKGDEIMVINGAIVCDLDMMYIESVLQEELSLCLMLRSSRTVPPDVSDFKCPDDIERLVVPPPPSGNLLSEETISGMIVPAPSWSKETTSFDSDAGNKITQIVNRNSSLELDSVLKKKGLSDTDKLRKVIVEMVETERSYVKHLNNLITNYLHPLQSVTFLNQSEVEALFNNILEIVEFQRSFLGILEDIIRKDAHFEDHNNASEFQDMLLEIGNAFLCYSSNFKLYSSFCAARSKAQKYLQPNEGNQVLENFLLSCNPKQQHSCTLESYLIKPIQRILKYPLLLQQLKSLSQPNTNVHKHLSEALQEMENVAEHINEMQRIYEEYGAIFDHLVRQHSRSSKQFVDLSLGELIHYGGIEWLNAVDFLGKIKKGLELHAMCFVFKTGVVLLCKEKLKQKKKLMGNSGKISQSEVEIIRYQILIPVSEVQVRCPNVKESDTRFVWELVHLKTQNQKRMEKSYQLANSTTDLRNAFLRTIRQIIRESVRNMHLPATQKSKIGSKTLMRIKPSSFAESKTNYDNLDYSGTDDNCTKSSKEADDVKSEDEESTGKFRPMLGKTPPHLSLSTTSTLSSGSSNQAKLIQVSSDPNTYKPTRQLPLGSPIWKQRESEVTFPAATSHENAT